MAFGSVFSNLPRLNLNLALNFLSLSSHFTLQAHQRDSPSGTGHGVFTFKHRWLVVSDTSTIPTVEVLSENITHVTILTLPKYNAKSNNNATGLCYSNQVQKSLIIDRVFLFFVFFCNFWATTWILEFKQVS